MTLPVPDPGVVARARTLFGAASDELASALALPGVAPIAVASNAVAAATHLAQGSHLYGPSVLTDNMYVHQLERQQAFGLEWLLRTLTGWPSSDVVAVAEVRRMYDPGLQTTLMPLLRQASVLAQWRDALMSLERGAYIAREEGNRFVFSDPPEWPGIRDYVCRRVTAAVSESRLRRLVALTTESDQIFEALHRDTFPFELQAGGMSGEELWALSNATVGIADRWMTSFIRDVTERRPRDRSAYPLVLSRSDLLRELERSGTPSTRAAAYLALRTFTRDTPRKFSLFHQPFIELAQDLFAIQPMTVLNSRPAPLLKRLLIHADKSAYDAYSGRWEKQTCAELAARLDGAGVRAKASVAHPWGDTPGEFDLVVLEVAPHVLWIVQVKDIVYPDTVPEVIEANDDVQAGLDQLNREREAIARHGSMAVMQRVGGDGEAAAVRYLLLTRGFLGSDYLSFPEWANVVSLEYLEERWREGATLTTVVGEHVALCARLEAESQPRTQTMDLPLGAVTFVVPGAVEVTA